MAPKPLKMNPLLNRLISNINDTHNNNITNNNTTNAKKQNTSLSIDNIKKKNVNNNSKTNFSKRKYDKPQTSNYRYQRNRCPLTSILFKTSQTSLQKKNTECLKPQHTDRQKHDNIDPILIIDAIKKTNKTTYNSKRNSKEKNRLNMQKPKRKLNTLIFSNDINNKMSLMQISSTIKGNNIQKSNNISSHHSPFKSDLILKNNKPSSLIQKQLLFSETELNKISTDLNNKNHIPSKNRLLIIQKPKNDSFALCTSKLSRNTIDNNIKSYCDSNRLRIEKETNRSNCYLICITTAEKFSIEISQCDNLTLLKFYHYKGKEELTRDYIKKAIVNVGF